MKFLSKIFIFTLAAIGTVTLSEKFLKPLCAAEMNYMFATTMAILVVYAIIQIAFDPAPNQSK